MTTTNAPKAPMMMNPFLPLPEIFAKNAVSTLGAPVAFGASAPNPFVVPASDDVPENAPEGSYTYQLVQSAPEVPAEECEVDAAAIEIVIRWGASTLHVAHLTPPRAFIIGEAADKTQKIDFELPSAKLGARSLPVVKKMSDGSARLVIPANAKGHVAIAGQIVNVKDLVGASLATPSDTLAGGIEVALRASTKAKIELGDIEIEVASVNAGRKVKGGFSADRRSLPFSALALALHVGLLGTAAVLMPPMALAAEDEISHDQMEMLRHVLSANAEREMDESKDDTKDMTKTGNEGGTGTAAKGESGKMGSTASNNADGRWGAAGPKDNQNVQLSKEAALRMAADFGMIGLLRTGAGGDPNAPTVPWGGLETLGNDPRSALGNMWGSSIGEASGLGGLGLTGVGEGAGGLGEGVGVGRVGTYGHGSGIGDGQGFGPGGGSSFGRARNTHKAGDFRMRQGDTETKGHIPPEVIQRIVRQNFGRFRLCYENGLRNNPSLQGRVSVKFVIGRSGGVMSASNGGSDLPDSGVVSCVVNSFVGLQFPQSEEGGIVTVSYPISFAPVNK